MRTAEALEVAPFLASTQRIGRGVVAFSAKETVWNWKGKHKQSKSDWNAREVLVDSWVPSHVSPAIHTRVLYNCKLQDLKAQMPSPKALTLTPARPY
jgi:hypothetical protein